MQIFCKLIATHPEECGPNLLSQLICGPKGSISPLFVRILHHICEILALFLIKCLCSKRAGGRPGLREGCEANFLEIYHPRLRKRSRYLFFFAGRTRTIFCCLKLQSAFISVNNQSMSHSYLENKRKGHTFTLETFHKNIFHGNYRRCNQIFMFLLRPVPPWPSP